MLDITLSELEELAKLAAERKIFDKCYELARKLFMNSQIGNPDTTSEIIQMVNQFPSLRRQYRINLIVFR